MHIWDQPLCNHEGRLDKGRKSHCDADPTEPWAALQRATETVSLSVLMLGWEEWGPQCSQGQIEGNDLLKELQ